MLKIIKVKRLNSSISSRSRSSSRTSSRS